MTAGRGIDHVIADWLVGEAPGRAPDRILDESRLRIDHTAQRRFAAMWREPMIVSMGRLVAAAAIVLVALVAAGFIGRTTASVGQPSSPTPVPTASASPTPSPTTAVSLATFRAARNAICQAANPQFQPLKDQLAGVYDANLSKAQRDTKIAALEELVSRGRALRQQLAALQVPPEMALDQAASLTRSEDVEAILVSEINLLHKGKLSEAYELDQTTDPINSQAEQFEQKYDLSGCP